MLPSEFIPAHARYCTGEDNLRLSVWCANSGVTNIALTGRFRGVDGKLVPLSERLVPTTDRTLTSGIFPLGEGWLEDLRVVSNGSPLMGQVFVRVELVRGLGGGVTPLAVLAQGLCNAVQPLAWPGSALRSSLELPGHVRVVTGTNPAAGAEISETVPAGARWELLSMRWNVTTSAVAGSRIVTLFIDDGTTPYFYGEPANSNGASNSYDYTASPIGVTHDTNGSYIPIPIPPGILMLEGHRIRTATANLDAGDNFGAPLLLVREWLEAAA